MVKQSSKYRHNSKLKSKRKTKNNPIQEQYKNYSKNNNKIQKQKTSYKKKSETKNTETKYRNQNKYVKQKQEHK